MATINYCNYEIKGTLSTTSTITAGGIITAPGGNSTQWNTGYDRSIVSFSDSGSSTITLTLTRQDGVTYTTSFSNPQGTVTSVGISHGGNAFSTGSAVTTSGTLAITMAGSASQYVNGAGNLTTFPSIPQGDITAVVAGNKLTGGGTSGSVTLGLASNNISQWTNDSGFTSFAEPGIFSGGGTPSLAAGVTGAEIRTLIGAGTSSSAGVTSVGLTSSGNSLQITNTPITSTGNLGISFQGDTDEYINGEGDLVSFPSIPQGDITAVTAGSGLTGGGTSGAVTLNVGAGNLIDVTSTAVNVDLSELTSATGDMVATDSFAITKSTGSQFKMVPGLIPNDLFPNDAGYITSASLPTVNNGTLTMTTSAGLDGGTTFTANQSGNSTFSVSLDLSELTDMTATMLNTDEFIVLDNGAERRKAAGEIGNSIFSNTAGYTTNVGDITAVVAGNKLTGGGTSGSVTLGLASNNISQWTNDSGYTTNIGDITGVTAGTNLTGGGTSGTVTLNMATGGVGAGSYGSTSNSTKIDTISVDAYGRVTAVATGATGQVNTINSGNSNTLTKSGSTTVTLTPNTGTVNLSSSNLATGAQIQTAINTALTGVLQFEGTWNASTNSPSLSSGTGTSGDYYIVSVAGSTNLDGITDWAVGDWAVFANTTWTKIDNSSVGSMSSFIIKEGNGTETSTVTNGETITFAQGTGIQSELTSTSSGGTLTITNTSPNIVQTTITGNAGTATALQTPRTIAGVSFNGTSNISLNNNAITNGAGYITSGSLPTVNNGILTMSTGTGLDGGTQTFSANSSANVNFTITLDLSELTDMTAAMIGSDEFIVLDAGAERRKAASEIGLSIFNNDAGFTTNVGDITSVTAGTGMSGGGTSGAVTLNCTITNTNQLTNGAGYITASSSDTLTNKGGNISQWTNDSGYLTSAGSMSSWILKEGNGTETSTVSNGETVTFAQGAGIQTELTSTSSGGTLTITNTITNNNQLTNGAGYITSASLPSVGNGQIDGRTSGNGLSGSMDATANQSGNTTFTVTSNATTAATASTIAYRDGSADLSARLFRANYANQGTISGAIAFRVNNSSDNYTRYCSSPSAIRTFIGAASSSVVSGVTSVATGNGISGGTITSTGTLTVGAGDGLSQSSTGLLVDSTVVRTSGAQSIADTKTFTTTPISVTRSTADSSTYLATTAFVKNQSYIGIGSVGIINNLGSPSLGSGITAVEVRSLIGAGTSSSSGVTSVATTNGITGGTITSTGTIQLDSTVVRTTGNQSITGSKSFNSTINANADLDMEGGSDILLSASGRIACDGDYGSAGQVLTSTGSVQQWSTPASGGITGSGTDNQVAFFNGTSAIESSVNLTQGSGALGELGIGGYVSHIGSTTEKFGFGLSSFIVQMGTTFQTFQVTGTTGQVRLGHGSVFGFLLETTATGVDVNGIFNAEKIAYTPITLNRGIQNGFFGATPGSTIKLFNLVGMSSGGTNVSQAGGDNYWVAPAAGRIKSITVRNVKDTPTSGNTRFKIYKNGSNSYTSSYITPTGANSVGQSVQLNNINHTFSNLDRINIGYQGQTSTTNWGSCALTIVIQLTDYEY